MPEWHERDCGVAGGFPHSSDLCESPPYPKSLTAPSSLVAGRYSYKRELAEARTALAEATALLRRWRTATAFGTLATDTDAFLASQEAPK